MALEFAFTGAITIDKKLYTKWSALRAKLGSMIANAAVSPSAFKGDEEAGVASVLAAALSAATGVATNAPKSSRTLAAPKSSVPIAEEDLALSLSEFADPMKEFLSKNSCEKKMRFHVAFTTLQATVDDKIQKLLKEYKGKESSLELIDVMMTIGSEMTIPLPWTEFAGDIVEFSVQQGGFPEKTVGALFNALDDVKSFASLRAQYAIGTLIELFSEDNALASITQFGNVQKVVSVFKPMTSEKTKRLIGFVGQWDAALKPRTTRSWASSWVNRFDEVAKSPDINMTEVTNAFVSTDIGFKGKSQIGGDAAAAETRRMCLVSGTSGHSQAFIVFVRVCILFVCLMFSAGRFLWARCWK